LRQAEQYVNKWQAELPDGNTEDFPGRLLSGAGEIGCLFHPQGTRPDYSHYNQIFMRFIQIAFIENDQKCVQNPPRISVSG
jgi:hypothetical protein